MNTPNSLAWIAAAVLLAVDPLAAGAQQPLTLTLGDAARFAAEHSAGPEAARYRVDMAQARLRQQRADLLPSVEGTLGWNARTFNSAGLGIALSDPATGTDLFAPGGEVLGPVSIWDVRATARQRLIDVSAFARFGAGRAAVEAADAYVTYESQQAAAAAAAAYVRALRAEAQLAGRQQDSALAQELLGIARRQLETGMGTTLDVTRAQTRLADARAQLIGARAERERTRLELCRALGVPLDTRLVLADSLAAMPTTLWPAPGVETGEYALSARGDLLAIEAQLAVVERQLRAIKAERFPTVFAFADGGSTGAGLGSLLHTYSWGLLVSIPVFDGLRRDARIAEQRSAASELEARRRDLVEQVRFEIRDAVLQVSSAEEQRAAAAEKLALADQELALAKRRFTEGVSGNADVIAAQLGLSAARTHLVDARAAFQFARIALYRAQGAVTRL